MSCASTYTHSLINIGKEESETITVDMLQSNMTNKRGWVRISLHPIMRDDELLFICNAIREVAANYKEWQKAYQYNATNNDFENLMGQETIAEDIAVVFTGIILT